MLRQAFALYLFVAATPSLAAAFHALALPGSQLAALSADGRCAAGGLVGGNSGGFIWSEDDGAVPLVDAMSVRAISPNGRYVAGSSLDAEGREVAAWWSADGRTHTLGGFADAVARAGVLSAASGVADDLTIVGAAVDDRRSSVAFAWSPSLGMRALDAGDGNSSAIGISRDGRRIYGWRDHAGDVRTGAIWGSDRTAAMRPDVRANEFVGADPDANMLLGIEHDERGRVTAFAWSPDKASAPVVFEPVADMSLRLVAASGDGRIIVGSIGGGAQRIAVIWTVDGGVRLLDAFAQAHGIVVPPGWTLVAATAISADGHRIGGYGLREGRFDSFVIDLPPRAASAPATKRTAS